METEKIQRRQQFRTIEVSGFPAPGAMASQVLEAIRPQLENFKKTLPPGYKMEIGGEQEEQDKGFHDLTIVLLISITCIYLALVVQFRNAIKPFIVFATIPYGMVGALIALLLMGQPFGFMAFLGIISLVGVIISHVIVLFDFIEEKHAEGEPLEEALLDAGIIRLRPVMITVGATVLGLIPLALHGGPLWEPLCYASDRRPGSGHLYHPAPGAGVLQHLRDGSEDRHLGNAKTYGIGHGAEEPGPPAGHRCFPAAVML